MRWELSVENKHMAMEKIPLSDRSHRNRKNKAGYYKANDTKKNVLASV